MAKAPQFLSSLVFCLIAGVTCGQSLYKYQDQDGEWVFTDRAPGEDQSVEVRQLPTGMRKLEVTVDARPAGQQIHLVARNEFPVPVEVIIALDKLQNLGAPPPERSLRWVLDPDSELTLMSLDALDNNESHSVEFRYRWLPGDPDARHDSSQQYRAPFAVAKTFPVSQSYPLAITHQTPDSYYAVDMVMPIGTDIHAARSGIVFEVASTNFRGGTDPERDMQAANLVRVMHDDGSQAIYAHLNWNSIRVRPGDRIERGQYIADSGNTGFSSGPHLHFVVLVNRGMRLVSVPVLFAGSNAASITATAGESLTAY